MNKAPLIFLKMILDKGIFIYYLTMLRDVFGTPRGAQMLTELESRRAFLFFRKDFVIDLTVTNNAYAYLGGMLFM